MQVQFRGERAILIGETPEDILEQARAAAPYPEASLAVWMAAYAGRYKMWHGKTLNCSSVEAFWEGLKEARAVNIWS